MNRLSEITAHGDHVYIVERDNQIGRAAVTTDNDGVGDSPGETFFWSIGSM